MHFEDCGDGLFLPDGRIECLWCDAVYPYDSSAHYEQAMKETELLKSMSLGEKMAYANRVQVSTEIK